MMKMINMLKITSFHPMKRESKNQTMMMNNLVSLWWMVIFKIFRKQCVVCKTKSR